MVNNPEIQKIIKTITDTYQELAEINEGLGAYFQLIKRRKELEEKIMKLKEILGIDRLLKEDSPPLTQSSFPLSPAARRHTKKRRYKKIVREKKLWQLAEDLLKEVGRDMSFEDIQLESQVRGWGTNGKEGAKIFLRAIQAREGTVFVKTDRGTWDLKERVEQKEQYHPYK
jgi:hypothetical protein